MRGVLAAGAAAASLTLGLSLVTATSPLGATPAGAQAIDGRHRGFGDAGGFRNLLPPGQDGVINGPEQIAGQAQGGDWPEHVDDQLPPYAELIRRGPGLDDADLEELFKDASFGVPADDIARAYAPTDGALVIRDGSAGVPHIFGETRYATMFAQGYTAAEDRLFLMDILRHLGRARLSEFIGPSEANQQRDRDQLAVAPYREEDLTEQAEPKDAYGPVADDIRADAEAYVDGVNAYVAEALVDPRKRPAEYEALQQLPEAWRLEDLVATASLVGGIFGGGGGGELLNWCGLQAMTADVGASEARAIFEDVRFRLDPDSPVTTERRFEHPTGLGPVDPDAVPGIDCATLTPIGGTEPAPEDVLAGVSSLVGAPPVLDGPFGPFALALPTSAAASNALLVSGEHTATGAPLAVFGPQTGYFVPQLLVEKDVHGPGISARGVAFAGTDLYVSIGRGAHHAWSATSSKADATDTFVVELCEPAGGEPTLTSMGHVHDGACVPIDGWNHTQVAKPTAAGQGSEVLLSWRVERSPVYGPLIARGRTADGTPIAVARHRVTYMAETTSALGFFRVNDPDFMADGFDAFRRAMGEGIFYSFNWFYVDGEHIGYQHSCGCPTRAPGVDPDLPVWGTGAWDWEADLRSGSRDGLIPLDQQPWDLDPRQGHLTSWNNRQAHGWAANDRVFSFGPVHRSQLLDRRLAPLLERGAVTLPEAVAVTAQAATTDLRGQELIPLLERLLGPEPPAGGDARVGDVWQRLRAWSADDGGHRIDRDGDGAYEHATAIAAIDAWWPRLVAAMFDERSARAFDRLAIPLHDPPQLHLGSAFHVGAYGHVARDLRQLLGDAVAAPASRTYCGGGDLEACRSDVWGSLERALADLEDEFGSGEVGAWRRVPADDAIVHVPAGIATVPDIDWQNRPTFQQVVQQPADAADQPPGDPPGADDDGGAATPATGGGAAAVAAGLLLLWVLSRRSWQRPRPRAGRTR